MNGTYTQTNGTLLNFNNTALHVTDALGRIAFWYYLNVAVVGIIGNLLSIMVVSRKQNRMLSCSIYMGGLAIADTVVLIAHCVLMFTSTVNRLTSALDAHQLDILCKVFTYLIFTAGNCSTMIILILLTERTIAVTFPLKVAVFLSPKRALITTIVLVIIAMVYNIPVGITTGVVSEIRPQCSTALNLNHAMFIYQITKVIFFGLVPFAMILTLNLVILCAVKLQMKKSRAMRNEAMSTVSYRVDNTNIPDEQSTQIGSTSDTLNEQDNNIERQLTIMTVVTTIACLLLTLPKYAHQVVFMNIDWTISGHRSALITHALYILNSGINCFLYFMTGSKFRSDLRALLRCKASAL